MPTKWKQWKSKWAKNSRHEWEWRFEAPATFVIRQKNQSLECKVGSNDMQRIASIQPPSQAIREVMLLNPYLKLIECAAVYHLAKEIYGRQLVPRNRHEKI